MGRQDINGVRSCTVDDREDPMPSTFAPTKRVSERRVLTPKQYRRRCALCNGPLRAIGHARKNGAAHRDWWGRKYHKLCYKQMRGYGA